MRWHAVIPTIGKSGYLPELLDALRAEGCDYVWLPVNQSGAVDTVLSQAGRHWAPGYVAVSRVEQTIYRSWNQAMDAAASDGALLAVLNDDIRIAPGSLDVCLDSLRWERAVAIVGLNYRRSVDQGADPNGVRRRVFGTFRTGGLGGFAFVVDPTRCARVHYGFRWWYGDDDLVNRTLDSGYTALVHEGAPVEHPTPSLSGNQMPWLQEACAADAELFAQLWP